MKAALCIAENTKGIENSITCNFSKFIVYSFLIGILPSIVLGALFDNFAFFLFSSIGISHLVVIMHYFKTEMIAIDF